MKTKRTHETLKVVKKMVGEWIKEDKKSSIVDKNRKKNENNRELGA